MKFQRLCILFVASIFALGFLDGVCAELLVSPQNSAFSQPWFVSRVYNLSLYNNGSETLYNFAFSPVPGFSFPSGVNVSANETKVISYGVATNELFNNRVFVSTLSYFVPVNYSPDERVVQVNITGSGLSPFNASLMQNDSVSWNNLLTSDVVLKDLGTGFQEITVPALSSVTVRYVNTANYFFYVQNYGFSGNLSVVPRSTIGFSHDSAKDKILTFTVNSILPDSTIQVSLLSGDISVSNNGTYREALIEVRNTDSNLVIRNVSISANKWVSSFSPNGFDLNNNGIQRVLFDITPYVSLTNLTNMTHKINLVVTTGNAGNYSKEINVFIRYMNMDNSTGGNQYLVNLLNINATIEACDQHMDDPGFEPCQLLKKYGINTTIIREVVPQYQIPENEMLRIRDAMLTMDNVSMRQENRVNLVLDRQDMLDNKTDINTMKVDNLSGRVDIFLERYEKNMKTTRTLFWTFFSLVLFSVAFITIVWIMERLDYYDCLLEAKQI